MPFQVQRGAAPFIEDGMPQADAGIGRPAAA